MFSLDTAVCPDDQNRNIDLVTDRIDRRSKNQVAEQPVAVGPHNDQVRPVVPRPFYDRRSGSYTVVHVQFRGDALRP